MKIEKIFRSIPIFKNIVLDTILFESRYPLMFTCRNGNDVYLFICCLVNADKVEWIGSETTYENLIELLQNEITIREAFLNVTDEKIIIEYNGQNVDYKRVRSCNIQNSLLPTEGEFMDADDDEYLKEIATFKRRNLNVKCLINSRINTLWIFDYSGENIALIDDYFNENMQIFDETKYNVERIQEHKIALA